jgi:hypothetical protein
MDLNNELKNAAADRVDDPKEMDSSIRASMNGTEFHEPPLAPVRMTHTVNSFRDFQRVSARNAPKPFSQIAAVVSGGKLLPKETLEKMLVNIEVIAANGKKGQDK